MGAAPRRQKLSPAQSQSNVHSLLDLLIADTKCRYLVASCEVPKVVVRVSRQQRQSGGGLIGVIGVLFLIGLIIKYIWWILAALGLVLTIWIITSCVRHYQSVEEARQRRATEIAARTEQQHRWVLDGDHRGIYGEEGAELMRCLGLSDAFTRWSR